MKNLALKINKKLYYGWMIVLLSGLAFFFSAPGQTYSISVFIDAYKEEFEYSSTLISTGYSIATTISGFLLIFMGRAIDRFGARKMMIIVGVLLAVTAFYNSFVTNIIMIFIGFFLLRYFGQGSLTLIPNSLIPQWFEKRRAFSISMAGIGNLLATLLVPAFNLWLITQIGWQAAWQVWSIVILVLFVPLAILFAVNKPEDIGLIIDQGAVENPLDVKASLLKMDQESFTLKQAVKTKAFWFAGIISTIPSMITTGITFHFFSMMSLKNVSKEEAAIIIGLIAIPSFFMPFLARLVIDRFQSKHIFIVTLTMVIASLFYLIFGVIGFVSAIVFVLVYGAAIAVQSVSLSVLWPNYFGRKHIGSIRGAATVFMVIGSALGPLPFGVGFDLTGGYNHVIFAMIIYTFISMVLAFMIKPPHKAEVMT